MLIGRFSLLCTVTAALAAALTAHASSLVGLYEFNNPADLGQDSSGNGNNLQIFGTGVSYTSGGEYGGGLVLTGSGGLTTSGPGSPVPTNFPLGNADYTISVWFETSIYQGFAGFIGWGDWGATDNVTALRLNGNGFRHYWWGDDLDGSPTSGSVNDGNWHNVTVTFDGTTRVMYYDGTVIAQNTPSGTHNAQNENFAIGLTNGSEYYQGKLDNVAVFDQALTQTQVQTIQDGDFTAFGLTVPEPASASMIFAAAAIFLFLQRRRAACRA